MKATTPKNPSESGFRINIRNKILTYTLGPFFLVMLTLSVIIMQNKIETERKLLVSRLNNYAVLLESGALSFESITQKDKLEYSLMEHVLTAEIIKDDYTTPYSTEPLASFSALGRTHIDRGFKEKNSIFFSSKGQVSDYLYPITHKGSVVGLFHVRILNAHSQKRIADYLNMVIFFNLFSLVVSFSLIMFLVKKGILDKLSDLMRGSKEIISGNLEYEINPKSNDELGDLARSFNEMTKNLHEAAASRDTLINEINERNLMLRDSEQRIRNANLDLEARVRQRTAELVISKERAETANRAKSVFLANMSHELRTPLNAILGFSSLMKTDSDLSERQKHNLDIINQSGEHLLHLLNDILDMAKIEAGRIQLDRQTFDLGLLIRDVTDMMRLRAKDKNLPLRIDQTSRFPRYFVGDEARLRQILINLLGNAIKYTQQGEVVLRLSTTENISNHLVIEVADTGVGIGPDEQQHIFDPFVQLGEHGVGQGAGLGLTITRQFVQMMGGEISLQSAVGEGSVFRIELPLIETKESDIVKVAAEEMQKVTGLAPGQPEYRILIVEDQYENQRLLSHLMESAGFRIKVANNGMQGVDLFRSWHPHLIWMDRRMPVMDGVEATKRIRQLPDGAHVKIIAVTASKFDEQKEEMLAAGMDDHVRKPYRASELYSCLTKHLGVEYLYDATPPPPEPEETLTPQMLDGLPEEMLRELETSLQSLESERIDAAIERIGLRDKTLQKTLGHLAENYDYPAILQVLQSHHSDNKQSSLQTP